MELLQTINKLTLIEILGEIINSSTKGMFECECMPGVYKKINIYKVKTGHTKSCGCLKRSRLKTHGMFGTPEYTTWQSMKDRCYNPNNSHYADYGGRGITVCERWLEPGKGFENFFEDMGSRPTDCRRSLDRKDNEGNYELTNCRWATDQEQHENKRSNQFITYNGITQTIGRWAEELGVIYQTLRNRIRTMSLEDAMTRPIREWDKVQYQGETTTIKELSDRFHISKETVKRRLANNSPLDKRIPSSKVKDQPKINIIKEVLYGI